MKEALVVTVFFSVWVSFVTTVAAAEKFYQVKIWGENISPAQAVCHVDEICFLTVPFTDDYIDVAVRFHNGKAVAQFMYEKRYLDTISIGNSVFNVPLNKLPVKSVAALYRKNPQDENVTDLRQEPVVRRGTLLTTINVTITNTP